MLLCSVCSAVFFLREQPGTHACLGSYGGSQQYQDDIQGTVGITDSRHRASVQDRKQ